ncbi:MAG TPA: zf-HC2 domain-containing protein [Candidatus Acidoferrales bacterium]|nr:zf-HC2 domain-containing protein [Candidatus Acidoferrales bacterium]
MNCTKIETKLMAYVDGRANQRERQEVKAHLEACALCRQRVEEFRGVSKLLDELPPITPSPAFDVRVRARVAAEPQPRGWLAWLTPSPRVAFAAALLLALTVWMSSLPTGKDTYPYHNLQNGSDAEFRMIKDLPVLQDYDVIVNFEPLVDLSQQQQQPPEANSTPDSM